ncbi:hypothetical protein MTP99_007633 [Tenebrio molitor]|nr:hypothetical protein MTP99_007633 [Tenebrio molitor]
MQLYQPVVLDETWVFSKGGNRKSWQDGSMATTSKKTGDGCRYIVLHAGNEDGFVENAGLIFKSTTRSGDYHDNMNRKNFENWFKTELIPNLEEPSLIIMDNASYHSGLQEEIPIKSWTKKKMKEWLQKKNVTFSVSDMKDQIWKIVSYNLPEKNPSRRKRTRTSAEKSAHGGGGSDVGGTRDRTGIFHDLLPGVLSVPGESQGDSDRVNLQGRRDDVVEFTRAVGDDSSKYHRPHRQADHGLHYGRLQTERFCGSGSRRVLSVQVVPGLTGRCRIYLASPEQW